VHIDPYIVLGTAVVGPLVWMTGAKIERAPEPTTLGRD
jgi:hypothetical protein